MVKVGRDLWRSLCPAALIKQDHLELIAQNHVPVTFEFLRRGRPLLLWAICAGAVILTVKEVLPDL